ncbi:MAG: copper-transporting ATPase, partial [Verrucomicrobiae bacterium]|nr:copper-transporting ATPase [Verrucomicrobiae bacterium]
ERDGQIFYFCSEHCRQQFLAKDTDVGATIAPGGGHACCEHEQQTGKKSDTSDPALEAKVGKYVCPMCEGVKSDQPGDCPKCGMPLERIKPAIKQTRTVYTCPMHPEIEQDGPGTCPKCGMDLEPTYVAAGEEEDDSELRSMTLRFWVAVALAIPVLLLAMLPMVGVTLGLSPNVSRWLQFALSTP